jgi:hypothetical protein
MEELRSLAGECRGDLADILPRVLHELAIVAPDLIRFLFDPSGEGMNVLLRFPRPPVPVPACLLDRSRAGIVGCRREIPGAELVVIIPQEREAGRDVLLEVVDVFRILIVVLEGASE